MSEKQLTNKILAYLRGLPDCWAFKAAAGPYQQPGIPDVLGCLRGQMFGLEVKVGGNDATKIQRMTLESMQAAGALAIVVRSVDEVRQALESGRLLDAQHNGTPGDGEVVG